MDTEQRVLSLFVEEIHGARAERVGKTRTHACLDILCDFRLAVGHFLRRMPHRPFLLPGDIGFAGPGKTSLANADAVTNCAVAGQDIIKETLTRIDDDRARPFVILEFDDLTTELLVHTIDRDGGQRIARVGHRAVNIVEDLDGFDLCRNRVSDRH